MTIVDYIRTMLEVYGADDRVLNAVPLMIQSALLKLQRKDLFPPTTLKVIAGEKRQTLSNADGEIDYEFINLPKDYRQMKRWYLTSGKVYSWVDNEFNLDERSAKRNALLYTIKDFQNDLTGEKETRLIMSPFPENTEELVLSYFIDGTESSLERVTKEYWEVILTTIMVDLQMKLPMEAESVLSDLVSTQQEREGHNSFNKARKRITPTFFASKNRGY